MTLISTEMLGGALFPGSVKQLSNDNSKHHPNKQQVTYSLSLSLKYYMANVNPECWCQYKARMPIDRIQPYLITNK